MERINRTIEKELSKLSIGVVYTDEYDRIPIIAHVDDRNGIEFIGIMSNESNQWVLITPDKKVYKKP